MRVLPASQTQVEVLPEIHTKKEQDIKKSIFFFICSKLVSLWWLQVWWLLWISILWYSAFFIKHLRNVRIFFHHGYSSLGISVLNIAATVSFGSWAPVMTKGMSRFPNNYVSTYILHNATLLYVKRGMQEYFVTTLIAAYASYFFS